MHQNSLYNKTYPAIYSEYPNALNAIYSTNNIETDQQKQSYLHELQNSARELWHAYRPRGNKHC